MLAQSLDSVGKDQFLGCGSCGWSKRFRRKRRRRDGFNDDVWRREGLGWERLRGLAGGEEEEKEQAEAMRHKEIVSNYLLESPIP